MSRRSRHSRRAVPTNRSATAFARGARTGVRMTSVPSDRNTSSKFVVNFVSQSRIGKRTRWALSARRKGGYGPAGLPTPRPDGGHACEVDASRSSLGGPPSRSRNDDSGPARWPLGPHRIRRRREIPVHRLFPNRAWVGSDGCNGRGPGYVGRGRRGRVDRHLVPAAPTSAVETRTSANGSRLPHTRRSKVHSSS